MSQALFSLVSFIFDLYIWMIIIRIILQWQREDYYNPLSQLVMKFTNLPLKFFYKLLPYRKGIDWGAIVFAFFIMLIKLVITMMLFELPLNPVNLLLFSVIGLVREVLSLYFYILLIVVVASWLMRDYVHPVLAALNRMVNPLLAPFRKGIPPIAGFDFSPLILLIIIKFLEIILASFTI